MIELTSLKVFGKFISPAVTIGALLVGGAGAWYRLDAHVSQITQQQTAQTAVIAADHDAVTRHTQQLDDLGSDVKDIKQDVKTLLQKK